MNDAKCLREKKIRLDSKWFCPKWCDDISTDASFSLGAKTSSLMTTEATNAP